MSSQFISDTSIINIAGDPQVLQCCVKFSPHLFSDGEYSKYGIFLPGHISRAVKKRRAEYLAARYACTKLLRELQVPGEVKSPNPPERSPIWPHGSTGSIAHCNERAVVIASTKLDLWIGVDIEKIDKSSIDTIKQAFTEIFPNPEERQMVESLKNTSPITGDQCMVLGFSAKESLFKALYAEVGAFFGFECAELVKVDKNTFHLRLTCALTSKLHQNDIFQGTYKIEGDYIITTLLIRCQ